MRDPTQSPAGSLPPVTDAFTERLLHQDLQNYLPVNIDCLPALHFEIPVQKYLF